MLSLGQKVIATVVVLFMNLLVLLFLRWFVVFTILPSALLLWVVLRR